LNVKLGHLSSGILTLLGVLISGGLLTIAWRLIQSKKQNEEKKENVLVRGTDGRLWVRGTDGRLWLEHPFGTRDYIDQEVAAFQAIDTQNVLVLGNDGNLWLEHPPWVRPGRIPSREQVDATASAFQAIDTQNVLVLGNDGNLWLEHPPFGTVPPSRDYIDQEVAAFQAIDTQNVLVRGNDGNLWLEHPPWVRRGEIPNREPVYQDFPITGKARRTRPCTDHGRWPTAPSGSGRAFEANR
jgi:ligand-binding sensor domain-containing protein